jgi:rRNA maturation protein Nop10
MTQRQKQITMGAGAMIVIITGITYWFWRPTNNENMPRGTWWICTNDSCKNEFSLTMAQFSEHHEKHYGQPVLCPKCKSVAVKADKCPSCGKVFVMQRNSNICPACGKPTSALEPQSRAAGMGDGDVAVGLGSIELLVVTGDPVGLAFDRAGQSVDIIQLPAGSIPP